MRPPLAALLALHLVACITPSVEDLAPPHDASVGPALPVDAQFPAPSPDSALAQPGEDAGAPQAMEDAGNYAEMLPPIMEAPANPEQKPQPKECMCSAPQVCKDGSLTDCAQCTPTSAAACTGATPVCSATSFQCVECVEDGHCTKSPVGRACVENKCAPCTEDKHCKDSPTGPACFNKSQCVQCTMDAQCGPNAHCDTTAHACVACLSNDHCPESAPLCGADHKCTACNANAECTRFSKVCDAAAHQCVQCTSATEATACGANACKPDHTCGSRRRTSVNTCLLCEADSECVSDHKCIAMRYRGTAAGAYCLKTGAGGCNAPYATPITRASVSGAPATAYCGIDETRASCAAVVSLMSSKQCGLLGAVECGMGGRCETVGLVANQCTYACTYPNDCPERRSCPVGGGYCGQ
jgi:hypothetical protein